MFIGCITNKQTRVFEPTMEGMYNDIIGEFRNTINNLCATNVCIPLYTRLRGMIHTTPQMKISSMVISGSNRWRYCTTFLAIFCGDIP